MIGLVLPREAVGLHGVLEQHGPRDSSRDLRVCELSLERILASAM